MKWQKIVVIFLLIMSVFIPTHKETPVNSYVPVVTAYAGNTFDPFSQIEFGAGGVNVGTVDDDALNYGKIMERYKGFLYFIGGFLIITAFASMIFRFFKLSASAGNEQERRKAIKSILATGITLSLMGGAAIIIPAIYNFFK